MSFVLEIEVPSYCFVPLNPQASCHYYVLDKCFFLHDSYRCDLFDRPLRTADGLWEGVILPCKECESKRKLKDN